MPRTFLNHSDDDNLNFCLDLYSKTSSVKLNFNRQNIVFLDRNLEKIDEYSFRTIIKLFPFLHISNQPFADGTHPNSDMRKAWRAGKGNQNHQIVWRDFIEKVAEDQQKCQICGKKFSNWSEFNAHHTSLANVYDDPDTSHYQLLCRPHHLLSAHRPKLTYAIFGTNNFDTKSYIAERLMAEFGHSS